MVQTELNRLIEIARNTIEAVQYGFFITHGPGGRLAARLVKPFPPERDLTIFLGVSPESRKVAEIRQDANATMAFKHKEEDAYVTLQGFARLENDPQLKRQYWIEDWRDIYPGGPESEDYLLIAFRPDRIELMNYARGIVPEPYGMEPAMLEWRENAWHILHA